MTMYEELRGDLAAWATHFHFNDETSLLLCKAADAIEDLDNRLNLHRQGKISHWIPVTERLPERNYNCLVCDDGVVLEGYMNAVSGWFDNIGDRLKFVTHWMPLPEPPKDGEA